MNNYEEQNRPARGERPLDGHVVVVTRPENRAEALSRPLRALGAEVLEYPTIRLRDPEDDEALRRAAARLPSYDWLVFTSPAGVERLARHLPDGGPGEEAHPSVAAIGPSTAETARAAGFDVQVVPEEYRAEALARALPDAAAAGRREGVDPDEPMAGLRVLLPRAAEARDVLPIELSRRGAVVDEVAAYVTVKPGKDRMEELRIAVAGGRVDWLTFTASSTVRNYVEMVGVETGGAGVVAIGPVTAGTARELGLSVIAVAEEYTVDGLVEALVRACRRKPAPEGR